jgi:hypothetical protein
MACKSLATLPDVAKHAGAVQPQRTEHSLGFSILRAWHERQYAEKCCSHLRALHRRACDSAPDLAGPPLYSRVVQQYLGCDEETADRILRGAEESYSEWPQSRLLTFRDVAHYLTVVGLCEGPKGQGRVETDLRPTIGRLLPAQW